MTLVQINISRPGPDGVPRPARGYLRWEPSRGRTVESGGIVLPLPFVVQLTDGTATVNVAPTEPGWAWKVTYQLLSFAHETHYFVVPDTQSVSFTELVEVDPSTLLPGAAPPPAWYEYVDAIAAGQMGAVHVVTGIEDRPNFNVVVWLGGSVQPTNMADGTDIWLKTA